MTVRAMLLAAGRGERMRPLTDALPKPLLPINGTPLIAAPLRALSQAGIADVVINLGYRGPQLRAFLQDGADFGLRIHYSEEGDPPLETGGGIFRALPLLGPDPFLVLNADVYGDCPVAALRRRAETLDAQVLAHLVMVPNPPQHAQGDFSLVGDQLREEGEVKLTYSGWSVLRPELFAGCSDGRFPLAPLLRSAMAQGRVSGECHNGLWSDIGTPERLATLAQQLG